MIRAALFNGRAEVRAIAESDAPLGRRQQARDCLENSGFSASGFPDKPQSLAACQVQSDAIDGGRGARRASECGQDTGLVIADCHLAKSQHRWAIGRATAEHCSNAA